MIFVFQYYILFCILQIQQLGRKTVQLLLQNNKEPFLLNWVLDHCYSSRSNCATLCFHALSSTFAKMYVVHYVYEYLNFT